MLKFALIIPILNGGEAFKHLLQSINSQISQPYKKLVIDSASSDHSVKLADSFGFEIIQIKRDDFNHGSTRQLGVDALPEADVIVFLTQDVVLADNTTFQNLLACFQNENVGAAYGRQIPHENAKLIASHARLFNYPNVSSVKELKDAAKYGIKTAFISNSFAAYRRSALMDIGGFPKNVIFGEDTYVAAKMLIGGWKVAYCAEAGVYHSHNYSYWQEFKRYFDTGVFHAREPWLQQKFGRAEGEGRRFVLSELKYLVQHNALLIPSAVIRTFIKWVGYQLGLIEKYLPKKLKLLLSMNKTFWENTYEQTKISEGN